MPNKLGRYVGSLSRSEYCIFLGRVAVCLGICSTVVYWAVHDPAPRWIAYGCCAVVFILAALSITFDRLDRAKDSSGLADRDM